MTNSTTEIIQKIKKLLSLSQSSNQHEAALAASMAQKFMLEHKLSIGDIDLAGAEKSPVSEVFVTDDMGAFKMMAWKGTLLYGISLLNGCTTLRYPKNRFQLIGRESDRQVVEYLACFLMREIERLAFADYEAQGFQDKKGRWNWAQAFGVGAARIIIQRMRDEQKEMEQSDTRVTALIVRENAALKDFMTVAHPHIRTLRSKTTIRSNQALTNGTAAGHSIQWRSGVGSTSARQVSQ
jgi:hypothetical protein